jgi:radical SAM superfamily enzyme with C-terminal helix-hairpin-helix motif
MENSKLNLNAASSDDFLAAIPNFSSRMVREFLEYRPYISIQQFRQEIGKYVDEAQVAEYELYVFVPVSVDDSDAATLMQIPGLDEAAAAALIAARPFGSNEAFLAKLAEIAPGVDPAVAAAYLDYVAVPK